MTDKRTLAHYEAHTASYITLYQEVNTPRIGELCSALFHAGGRTLDVGCGSGRDLGILSARGFVVEGLDAVPGFVERCRELYPETEIYHDRLPELEALLGSEQRRAHFEKRYDNILLSAVLMHLPRAQTLRALSQLTRLLREGGRALISVRGARVDETRVNAEVEPEGALACEREGERLFTRLALGELTLICSHLGLRALWSETSQESEIAGGDKASLDKRWLTLVVERTRLNDRRGLDQVQEVLVNDKKTSSYKFALLRGLTDLARERPFKVRYDLDHPLVWVPMSALAARWALYYWPLCGPTCAMPPIAQITGSQRIAVARDLAQLAPLFSRDHAKSFSQLSEVLYAWESGSGLDSLSRDDPSHDDPSHHQETLKRALKAISVTISKNPVKYTTYHAARGVDRSKLQVFSVASWTHLQRNTRAVGDSLTREYWRLGAIAVPLEIWGDLTRFWQWIDDSLSARWARFCTHLKQNSEHHLSEAVILERLTRRPEIERRHTRGIALVWSESANARCVWSGQALTRALDIDHVIPYSVRRRNELWNLLPTDPALNRSKGDAVPTLALLTRSQTLILETWSQMYQHFGERFAFEMNVGLGVHPSSQSLELAFERLKLMVSGLIKHGQVRAWEPTLTPSVTDTTLVAEED